MNIIGREGVIGIMLSLQLLKYVWSLATVVALITVLDSVVHLFIYPAVPYPDYFSRRQSENRLLPVSESIGLSVQFPADLNGAVFYHGAPWKAEIGQWLSGCNSNSNPVKIVEVLNFMNT